MEPLIWHDCIDKSSLQGKDVCEGLTCLLSKQFLSPHVWESMVSLPGTPLCMKIEPACNWRAQISTYFIQFQRVRTSVEQIKELKNDRGRLSLRRGLLNDDPNHGRKRPRQRYRGTASWAKQVFSITAGMSNGKINQPMTVMETMWCSYFQMCLS